MNARIALLAAVVAIPSLVHASTYTYDFSALTAGVKPANNESPAPAGVVWQGTTTIGQIAAAQDNWVWTSSATNTFGAIVRSTTTDPVPGMSGNYISGYPTASTAPSYDSINSRVNTLGGFNYSIPAASTFQVSFIANIQPTGTGTTRSQVMLGRDQNNDGDIRGDALITTENAEWGFIFGNETATTTASTFGTWYLRPAALGTAVTTPNTIGYGVFKITITVDPTKNEDTPNNATFYPGFDGAGILTVQRLTNGAGDPVTETPVNVLNNVNLDLTRMTTHNASNVGTTTGWDPSTWNGLVTRVSNGGVIDDIQVLTGADIPEPSSAALAIPALALLTRRRR